MNQPLLVPLWNGDSLFLCRWSRLLTGSSKVQGPHDAFQTALKDTPIPAL